MDWNPERARVDAEARRTEHWAQWGPYLSDRQWGTVREDYSATGEAWDYFPFTHAHQRAYRWGEDGIFGICDNHQRLCFAPAFWNGNDPIIKERFFGLSGPQGNHGEDVKECYYYLDNVPSHAYMKALYKYPQAPFPYADLVETNARRGKLDPEYELVDTGIFNDDAYFDIEVEYAKRSPTDTLIRITATNRGKNPAPLHVIPHLWFRNEWTWAPGTVRPSIVPAADVPHAYETNCVRAGEYRLTCEGTPDEFFVENETNTEAVFGVPNAQPYVKDGVDRGVRGDSSAANPARIGTKLGLRYAFSLQSGESKTIRLRLTECANARGASAGIDATFDATFKERQWEADRFYAALNTFPSSPELHRVQRTALAGMLWSKQFYNYVVRDWLRGDPGQPTPPPERWMGRNRGWIHLYNDDVISMPDTWEYPWYAGWDLAFHTVVLALVDPGFAKRQLVTLTREWYMHPNGEIPAYEWAFGDVNPPVQAWAAYRIFQMEHKMYGVADYLFLERVFQKLLMNFTWWVNREDPDGHNTFMGGFLGLDNIGVFDRSAPLPTGGRLLQSDATSWMAMYALDMMAIALELAQHDASYEDIASKFFEHFLYIAYAINDTVETELGLWDSRDGFYYDQLVVNGKSYPLRVRSAVGLLPLLAVETLQPQLLDRLPNFKRRFEWFIAHRPELAKNVASLESGGMESRRLLALVDSERLRQVLRFMFDENEFLSPNGIRSLSKFHKDHPFVIHVNGSELRVDYAPAESVSGLFGGNSNWRGPVWFPLNFLLIEALQNFHFFYGDDYRVEYPTGSGQSHTLWEVATDLSNRLINIFLPDADGNRPFNGGAPKLQKDPHFHNHLLFYEYFHGDNGAGIGASHQTGWTGLVAKLIQQVSEYESAGKSPLDWEYDATPSAIPINQHEAPMTQT